MTRITGGRLRGRSISIPKLPREAHLRPTLSKVRSAIFNSMQGHVEGAHVLDLFAGSGALGFEALSRDAASVLYVDASPVALATIRDSARALGVEGKCVFSKQDFDRDHPEKLSIFNKLAKVSSFDLIFIDPPFRRDWETWMIEKVAWNELLAPEGLLVIEWLPHTVDELVRETPFLEKVRQKTYGNSVVSTYRRKSA